MNIDLEFQRFMLRVHGDAVKPGSAQWVESRRVFIAGMHLAACRCRPDPMANKIVKLTMAFGTNVGERRN